MDTKRQLYYKKNKEKLIKYSIEYSKNNSDRIKEHKLKFKEKNPSYYKDYYKENSQIISKNIIKYQKKKYNNDLNFKLKSNLRARFHHALKKGNKIKSIIYLTGCNIEELKQYLEKQFKPEMNWENHGKVWEIDHIKPCSSFDLTKEEEQQKCFHYTNLQPLFKIENRIKSNKYGCN